MSFIVKCPGCQSPLRIREEYAGKQLKCPRCTHVMTIPATSPVEAELTEAPAPVEPEPQPEEVRVAPRKGPPVPADREHAIEEREPVPARQRRRDGGRYRDDDEDDDRRRGRGGKRYAYKPCPRCGGTDAKKVVWTPWGSFYGPAMFNHVRCENCGYAYNGRSGRSNLIPAIIFVTIPALLIALIIGGVIFILISSMRFR
jgi:hypothetical protein